MFIRQWQRFASRCIGGLLIVAATSAGYAETQDARPAKVNTFAGTSPILLLRDVDSGRNLFARSAETRFIPASLVKMMTAYTVLERVKAGKITLDKKVTVPKTLVARWQKWPRASSMRLRSGEEVTIDDLIHGMITASGNDAAELLAASVDGTTEVFVARMNRQAKRLGMTASQFGTVTGWPDGGKTKVTARDLSILAERILKDHPSAYQRYFGTKKLTRANGTTLSNRNPLLGRMTGVDGFKTGHTSEAGYTYVTSAQRDGHRLLVVLAGARSEGQRAQESRALLDAGFAALAKAPSAPAMVKK